MALNGEELSSLVSDSEYEIDLSDKPTKPLKSILKTSQEYVKLQSSDDDNKLTKSVSWTDLNSEEPLSSTFFIPKSRIDRSSIDSEYSRMRKDKVKKQDRVFYICCGSLIFLMVSVSFGIAFLMFFVFGYGFDGIH